ncbi:MAG TPA: DUF4403 family protein [Phnomibacter sp.]|nr:DUF4403 family protein [Phnomibacter sp.]
MRKFLWFLLGLLLLLALVFWWYVRQHQQKKIELPAAMQDTIPVKVPVSTFRLPINYALADLQTFLNQKIAGEFLETTLSPTGNDKDQVKVEMSRVSNIRLSAEGQQLVIQFPLQVKASIMQSRLRFITKGIKPVVTSVVLTLKTPASLDGQWRLVTKFNLASVKWIEPPVVSIAGVKIDLTKKCDDAIQQNKNKLTSLLDTEINKAVSLREPVGKIWEDLQKPIVIVKKPAPVYLRFICQEIGGDFSVNAKELVCYTTIKAGVAIVSQTNLRAPVLPLPAFQGMVRTSDLSDAFVYAFAEFNAINHELQRSLQGMTFSEKGITATIDKVQVYAADAGLVVQAAVRGDIDGDLVATGRPVFDSVAQQFQLQQFQFQLSSSSPLLNTGEALMHDRIRDTIQSKLMVGLDSQIARIPSIIEKAISKGKTGRTIDVEVGQFRIASCEVNMSANRIHLLVHVLFAGSIRLKHLNAGKAIRISPGGKKKDDANSVGK